MKQVLVDKGWKDATSRLLHSWKAVDMPLNHLPEFDVDMKQWNMSGRHCLLGSSGPFTWFCLCLPTCRKSLHGCLALRGYIWRKNWGWSVLFLQWTPWWLWPWWGWEWWWNKNVLRFHYQRREPWYGWFFFLHWPRQPLQLTKPNMENL